MFPTRKNENQAECRGDAQRAHPSPSSGPPDLSLSLSQAVSASERQSSSWPALSVTVTSVTSKSDFSRPRMKADLIVPSPGTAGT